MRKKVLTGLVIFLIIGVATTVSILLFRGNDYEPLVEEPTENMVDNEYYIYDEYDMEQEEEVVTDNEVTPPNVTVPNETNNTNQRPNNNQGVTNNNPPTNSNQNTNNNTQNNSSNNNQNTTTTTPTISQVPIHSWAINDFPIIRYGNQANAFRSCENFGDNNFEGRFFFFCTDVINVDGILIGYMLRVRYFDTGADHNWRR